MSVRAAAGVAHPTLLDTLCARLRLYEAEECDLSTLQPKFVVEWPDKLIQMLISTSEACGALPGLSCLAIALIATQMILNGVLELKGVHVP
ncbi:hypothetical protein GYMLUDRAFT_76004 [Collybiopsis luxurians FD-317 M1]|uniref:Uncharacterized protein n=1 Tax=Collybiopsis luxurians FD-317 M1 TaxID=944289 RepID=A0A0D0CEY9_9AGAR|nr:hypothetical protein GYMLUDRAFT_76004 [Collybiopsis luxurians FD-317 M1]